MLVKNTSFKIPDFILDTTCHNWRMDLYLLPWIFSFVLRSPLFSVFVLRKAMASSSHKVPVLRSVLRKMGIYSYFDRRKFSNTMVVVDEGVIHIAHNIFVSPDRLPCGKDIHTFVNNVPLPDQVIVCRNSREQLLENLKKRGQWTTRVRNEQELECFVDNAIQAFDSLITSKRLQQRLMVCDSFDAKQEIEQSLI